MMHLAVIGLGAGAAAALLFASVTSGTLLSIPLFYLAPLPIMIAGLGWGHWAALTAALAGSLALGIFFGAVFLFVFMVGAGIPVFLNSGADRLLIAPSHQSVEKAIRTAASEIALPKVLAAPAVDIIVELEISGKCLARGLAVANPRLGRFPLGIDLSNALFDGVAIGLRLTQRRFDGASLGQCSRQGCPLPDDQLPDCRGLTAKRIANDDDHRQRTDRQNFTSERERKGECSRPERGDYCRPELYGKLRSA